MRTLLARAVVLALVALLLSACPVVAGTPRVLFAVRTGTRFHQDAGRVRGAAASWLSLVPPEDLWFAVTDSGDKELFRAAKGRVLVTACGDSHSRASLCCKTAHQFQLFHSTQQRLRSSRDTPLSWLCHFDDDVYVLPANLKALLGGFDATRHWHIGPNVLPFQFSAPHATGAYCISAPLAERLHVNHMSDGRFERLCEQSGQADDLVLNNLMRARFNTPLTLAPGMHGQHSKQDKLPLFHPLTLQKAVTMPALGNHTHMHCLVHGDPEGRCQTFRGSPVATAAAKQQTPLTSYRFPVATNYCRHTFSPNAEIQPDEVRFPRGVLPRYNRCGPPAQLHATELEPLCRLSLSDLRGSLGGIAAGDISSGHRTLNESCSQRHESVPVFWGAPLEGQDRPVDLGPTLLPAHYTCCASNPDVPSSEGGDCYLTAAHQDLCEESKADGQAPTTFTIRLSPRPAAVRAIFLQRHQDRLDRLTARLESLRRPFKPFEGVDGRLGHDFAAYEREGLIPRGGLSTWRRYPGDVGVALSHFRLWQEIARGDEPWVLILEDDVVFKKGYDLTSFPGVPSDAEALWLNAHSFVTPRLPLPGTNVLQGELFGFGMVGYIVSREAARKFVECRKPLGFPIDSIISGNPCSRARVYVWHEWVVRNDDSGESLRKQTNVHHSEL